MDNTNERKRSRGFCFTWNNYPVDYRRILDEVQCRYVVCGEELAPTTATPHLQGYIYFESARTRSAVCRQLPGCHIIAARGDSQDNRNYCLKIRPDDVAPNEHFYERGDIPLSPSDKGTMERARYDNAWSLAKAGRIEEIDGDIRVRFYSSLKRIQRDFMPAVGRLDSTCGIWIFGESGAGKTRAVLDRFPNLYPKPRNVWWDGYQGERVVLVDDLDRYDVALGGKLKHWADCYPFIGECKGSSLKIRPSWLFVTSQYRIEDIWTDVETCDALKRRFVCIDKIKDVELDLNEFD